MYLRFMQNIILLFWFDLLLEFIESLKFDYVCTKFLNNTSSQTCDKKFTRRTIWNGSSSKKKHITNSMQNPLI
jgi:hypothetical protein